MMPLAVLTWQCDRAMALIVLSASAIVSLAGYGTAAWALVRLVMT